MSRGYALSVIACSVGGLPQEPAKLKFKVTRK